jgi:hypothetical protein
LTDGAINNNGQKPKHPTAPRFPNGILLSQNFRGYFSKESSSKKDHTVRNLRTFSDTPYILFTQETWSDNYIDFEIDNTPLKVNNRTKKEASESSYPHLQYMQASQIQSTRVMALELHFHNNANQDNANKINKLFAISTYLPCSSYKNNEYVATLAELDKIHHWQ